MNNKTLSLLLLLFVVACKPQYLPFENNPPGLSPKPFAKNLIAKNNEHVRYYAFSQDGAELYLPSPSVRFPLPFGDNFMGLAYYLIPKESYNDLWLAQVAVWHKAFG